MGTGCSAVTLAKIQLSWDEGSKPSLCRLLPERHLINPPRLKRLLLGQQLHA